MEKRGAVGAWKKIPFHGCKHVLSPLSLNFISAAISRLFTRWLFTMALPWATNFLVTCVVFVLANFNFDGDNVLGSQNTLLGRVYVFI